MVGSVQVYYEIVFFWLEDYSQDLKKIIVLVLVMYGEDDQIVLFVSVVLCVVELFVKGSLKIYFGFFYGMLMIYVDVFNCDFFEFIKF